MVEGCSDSTWTRREQARQRQIAIGKARPEYRRYVQEVAREGRDASHPSTPDPRARISKRQFDRTLSAWRCRLHEYDVPRAAAEGSRGDADITPLSRRTSQVGDDLDSELPDQRISRCFPRSSEDGGIVPLRLADALRTPVTPQLSACHHHLHYAAQPAMLAGVMQPHLQLGPRQLDFGAGLKQAWQPCSPMDGTPSTTCTTFSPITPAPRNRPALHHNGVQQTVFESETPDRPRHPWQHSLHPCRRHAIGEDTNVVCRSHSPGASRKANIGPETPPRTPPRKFDPGFAVETEVGVCNGEGGEISMMGSDPSSAQRHGSPPSSAAKTPSYCMGWVRSTPSPQSLYRGCGAYASGFGEASVHSFADSRAVHCLADVPSMLPQQPQHPIHNLHTMPWSIY